MHDANRRSSGAPLAVLVIGVDLGNAVDRHPVTLLDRKRMIDGLELDVGVKAVAQMKPGLEVLGARMRGSSAESQLKNDPR